MKRNASLFVALLLAWTVCSCESTTTPVLTHDSSAVVKSGDRAVFILNEGAGSNTSSIDAVIFRSSPLTDTIRVRNILSHLGEANDIRIMGNRAYVIDNSSNQLLILNADSLKLASSIVLGTNGPNKLAQIGSDKLIVTQRGASYAAIVSTTSNSVVDSINTGVQNTAVATLGGTVWVTNSPFNAMGNIAAYKIDTKQLLTSIPGFAPEILLADSSHNQIIVGCQGDYVAISPVIYFIDGTMLKVTDSIVAGAPGTLSDLILGTKLYVVKGNSVDAIDLTTHQSTPWITNAATSYYKGGYDAKNGQIYLGPADFAHESKVDVYDATTAKLLWSAQAGIAPAHFAFYR